MAECIAEFPSMEERRRVMDFVMAAGKTLLENGAEVFRVEQTMIHIARGFHLREFHVYVITNGIFASAGTAEHCEIRNVPTRTIHLGRVEAINALSREIAAGEVTVLEAETRLHQINQIPTPSTKIQVLASAFGAFSFCMIFGGSLMDGLVSLVAGAGLGGYLCFCNQKKIENLFQRLSGAALVALFCLGCGLLCQTINASAAIIGAFMLLTPGVAFTMAIRDFVHSDYLSGTIRMIDAILVAASIAIGAALMLWVEGLLHIGGVS